MKLVRYVCSHCSRKFEAEEKDIVECPGCYWTSSVKREDDLPETSSKSVLIGSSQPDYLKKFSTLPWKPLLGSVGILLLLVFLIKVLAPVLGKLAERTQNITNRSDQAVPRETSKEKLQNTSSPEVAGLTPEEQNILNRRVQLSADRVPSVEDQKILANRAAFKSGFSEKLPSQAWTIENFKDMIAQQEKFYQVPLPRSYKNKLQDLFKEKYLAGGEAFKNGDLLGARNLWVESLAFPAYTTNPEKHRGVILTMLRPFINDTLSKIGAINGSIVEKGLREKEQAVVQAYEKIFSLIEQKSWQDGVASIGDLNQKLDTFSNPTQLVGPPGEYPQGISGVDRDIQFTLRGLLSAPPPATSDLEPIRTDALQKRRVMEGFIPEKLQARQQKYDEGLDAITRREWAAAEKAFKEVDLPSELSLDALEKIKILKKLQKKSLMGEPQASAA